MMDAQFRVQVQPHFYPRADEMRSRYVEFFSNPSHASREKHFKLNYWHVPTCYTYIRSHADDILGLELINHFHASLTQHVRTLGFSNVTMPLLSIYVNGCYQSTHSDMMNGSLAYVFSITDWDRRKFDGGETLIARENIFDKLDPREHRGWSSYWDAYPGYFNQLLLFDDRLAHAVVPIAGTMDPLDARCVLHGHIT